MAFSVPVVLHRTLQLDSNSFTGTVPNELSVLTNLT